MNNKKLKWKKRKSTSTFAIIPPKVKKKTYKRYHKL